MTVLHLGKLHSIWELEQSTEHFVKPMHQCIRVRMPIEFPLICHMPFDLFDFYDTVLSLQFFRCVSWNSVQNSMFDSTLLLKLIDMQRVTFHHRSGRPQIGKSWQGLIILSSAVLGFVFCEIKVGTRTVNRVLSEIFVFTKHYSALSYMLGCGNSDYSFGGTLMTDC